MVVQQLHRATRQEIEPIRSKKGRPDRSGRRRGDDPSEASKGEGTQRASAGNGQDADRQLRDNKGDRRKTEKETNKVKETTKRAKKT